MRAARPDRWLRQDQDEMTEHSLRSRAGTIARVGFERLRRNRYLRSRAFVIFMALVVIGAWRMAIAVGPALVRYPRATLLAIVLFALYAAPIVMLMRWMDFLDPVPTQIWIMAIGCGAFVSSTLAISGNAIALKLLGDVRSSEYVARWGVVLVGPSVEGGAKLAVMFLIILLARSRIHSVVDGFLLGAMVGVGFQLVENILFAVNASTMADRGDVLGPVLETFLVRGFIVGPWSHPVFAAIEFAGFAYFVVRRDRPLWNRLGVAVLAQVLGWCLHALWNLPWALGWYSNLGILATTVIKGVIAVTALLVPLHLAQLRQARGLAGGVAGLGDSRLASPAELAALGSLRLRLEARNAAHRQCGRAGRRMLRQLQQAQARLAVAISRHPDRIVADRRAILQLRTQAWRLGLRAEAGRSAGLPWRAWAAGGCAAVVVAIVSATLARRFYHG